MMTIPQYLIFKEKDEHEIRLPGELTKEEKALLEEFKDKKLLLSLALAENECADMTLGT